MKLTKDILQSCNNKKKKIPLSGNLFKLTRTDKNEGWNDNLIIFIRKKNN